MQLITPEIRPGKKHDFTWCTAGRLIDIESNDVVYLSNPIEHEQEYEPSEPDNVAM